MTLARANRSRQFALTVTACQQRMIDALTAFVAREGHARVRSEHSEDNLALGQWVTHARHHRRELSSELCAILEALPGWTWDGRAARGDAAWETAFALLVDYTARVGTACVPQHYIAPNDFSLGIWVRKQRGQRDRLPAHNCARLTALDGWTWNGTGTRVQAGWDAAYRRLLAFVDAEGTALVAQACKAADGFNLGAWVHRQRADRAKLTAEQQHQLEHLPGWTWRVRDARARQTEDAFAERVACLTAWAARTGNACPPSTACEPDGFRLGWWVSHMRSRRASLTAVQQQVLEAVPGWTWAGLGRGVGRWRREAMA